MDHSLGTSRYLLAILGFLFLSIVTCKLIVFFERPGLLFRLFSWLFGLSIVVWTVIVLIVAIVCSSDDYLLYGNGWAIQGIHISEEYRYIDDLTHWFGQGDPYYHYTDEQSVPTVDNAFGWTQEPCFSASMERCKANTVFWDYRGTSLLSVVSYRYGQWYFLLYCLVAVGWTIISVRLLLEQPGILRKLFLFIVLLPLLICGIGPIFSKLGFFYLYLWPLFSFPSHWQDWYIAQLFFMSIFISFCFLNYKRQHILSFAGD